MGGHHSKLPKLALMSLLLPVNGVVSAPGVSVTTTSACYPLEVEWQRCSSVMTSNVAVTSMVRMAPVTIQIECNGRDDHIISTWSCPARSLLGEEHTPVDDSTTTIAEYINSIIPRGGGDGGVDFGDGEEKNNILEYSEPPPHDTKIKEDVDNKKGNQFPKRLFNVARNLIGRTANIISLRPRRKLQQDNPGVDEMVDHSFDELDQIIANSNTTTEYSTWGRSLENKQANIEEVENDLLDTLPPLPQAESLLEGWRKQRSLSSWINKIKQKYVSSETAKALTTIRNIIDAFPDYGVIDIFGMYSPKDVVLSIVALSRLQHILASDGSIGNNNNNRSNHNSTIDKRLLEDLAHYCVFANAAYGWKGLAFCGRIHLLGANNRILTKSTGIDKKDIVTANWHSKANRPAYFVARDMKRKSIVLGIRGSLSPRDILTDLCASSENFIVEDIPEIGDIEKTSDNSTKTLPVIVGRAHKGMVDAARSVARLTGKAITDELQAHPDFSLVIVGHSLGGGVAAVIAAMWQRRFAGRVQCFSYGSPCVFPLNITGEFDNNIVTVVGKGDPFATISLGHLADATKALSKLCQDKGLRDEILKRASGGGILMNPSKGMQQEDYEWCANAMTFLRKQMDSEKLLPPGTVYHLSGPLFEFQTEGGQVGLGGDTAVLKPVDPTSFNELKLHARMFDVSLHIPVRYEMLLRRLASAEG